LSRIVRKRMIGVYGRLFTTGRIVARVAQMIGPGLDSDGGEHGSHTER
jgi:hypothetical protein